MSHLSIVLIALAVFAALGTSIEACDRLTANEPAARRPVGRAQE